MLKFRLLLCWLFAASILVVVDSNSAQAQKLITKPQDIKFYTNNPCASPDISWALWAQSGGITKPNGGGIGTQGDCDPSNYGSWSTAADLQRNLNAYKQSLSRQGIVFGGTFRGKDGHQYIVYKNGSSIVGLDAGLCSTNGGNVIAQGGGNFISGANVIAQGGGNLIGGDGASVIAQGGGNVIAQGGGNLRHVMAAGEKGFQFPNKWIVVSGPTQASKSAAPPSTTRPGTTSTTVPAAKTSQQIQTCLNSTVTQIRQRDGGANHINFSMTGSVAYLTGNVLTQSYKDILTNAAKSCAATGVSKYS
jgi:hypothetical protein